MAHIKPISQVKLIVGIMYKDKEIYEKIVKVLIDKYGNMADESEEYDFDFTSYYEKEMGKDLKKKIIVFGLIHRDSLSEIKHTTNDIENEFSEQGRKINLDPGYMTEHNIILASAKELPHKVSIGKGMFGDVVLQYRKKDYEESRHTFPDFRTRLVKDFLIKTRKKYMGEIK